MGVISSAAEVRDKFRLPAVFTLPDEDARRFAVRLEAAVAALADEATTDWWQARRRAHASTTPSLSGPTVPAPWRRMWALDERTPLASEPFAQRGVAGEPLDRPRQRVRVVRRDEQPRLAVAHELGDTGDGTTHDRPRRRHRLHEDRGYAVHVAGAILPARHDEGVTRDHLTGDLVLLPLARPLIAKDGKANPVRRRRLAGRNR